jgi:hypothetical protein
MRLARWITVVAVVGATVAAPVGTPPASAAAACTANMEFNYAPGITVIPAGAVAVTGTLVLNCPVLGPEGGMWTLLFGGVSGLETCEGGTGTVPLLPGSSGPPGAVAGTFLYIHYFGGAFAVLGTLTWPGNTRNLVVAGEWVPVLVPGDCVLGPVAKGVATGVAAVA